LNADAPLGSHPDDGNFLPVQVANTITAAALAMMFSWQRKAHENLAKCAIRPGFRLPFYQLLIAITCMHAASKKGTVWLDRALCMRRPPVRASDCRVQ
jgi:hypothetical protein